MASFAVIPAAGHSRRMGRPKLLLPWGDSTVIQHAVSIWQSSGVTNIVVVVRPDDAALIDAIRASDVEIVIPDHPPAEMKASVRIGLEHIRSRHQPRDEDVWLLAPADAPRLAARVIDLLIASHDPRDPAILAPSVAGRRGHPVLFPWPLAAQVAELADGEGVNALLDRNSVRLVLCDDRGILADLDTPEDYERLRHQAKNDSK